MKKLIIAVFISVMLMSCTIVTSPITTETSVSTVIATRTHTFIPTNTVSLTATPSLTLIPTPTDTSKMLNPQNNHWYQVFSVGKNWLDARDYCAALDGHLVTIESESENEFVYNLLPYGWFSWIGLTDSVQEGNWQWVTGEPLTYANWHSGQPDNCANGCWGGPPNAEDEDYAHFHLEEQDWDDWGGASTPFVCEWETPK